MQYMHLRLLIPNPQLIKTMKLIPLLLFVALVQVSAESYSQEKISISEKNASLEKIFKEIRKQSKYDFLYINEQLQGAPKVSVVLKDVSLEQALKEVLKNSSFTYSIQDKTIVIRLKEEKKGSSSSTDGTGLKSETPPPPPPTIDLRGIVVNEKGEPVEGATVAVKGTDKKTSTNGKGEFTLNGVNEKLTLVISAVTIETKEVNVNGQVFVKVEVSNIVSELDETVVVAYGRQKQQSLTGAVTVVKGEQIQSLPNRSFDKSLQGLVPGLLVTSGNGQPGAPPSNFMLRGIATGGQPTNGETFRNPLIVVDGVPVLQEPPSLAGGGFDRITNPLAQLNPSDIETISVLKDAAAVALYGSQASNGVILVTTKRGKSGKTVFNFRHQTDISSALEGKIDMLNQKEYLELLYESHRNSNASFWTDARIDSSLRVKFPLTSNGKFYPGDDWSAALLNMQAVTVANEISMSGGTEKSNFYLNLEYTKQDGVAKNTGYDRKSVRFNYEHRPTSWFKFGLNTTLSHNVQSYSKSGFNSFLRMVGISPLNSIRDDNGNFIYRYSFGMGSSGSSLSPNPVAQTELDINQADAFRGLSRLNTEIRLAKNISFNSVVGVDFMLNEAKEKNHPLVSTGLGYIQEQQFRTTGIVNTNLLQFNKQWSKVHSLNILAGQETRIQNTKFSIVTKNDLTGNPDQDQLDGGNTIGTARGNISKQNLLSWFGQLNYGFKEKYYLTGSIRSDGSSRFGKNNRFGTYWSSGAAWLVSSEPFMQFIKKWVSYFKLRGSMGPAGNSSAIIDRLRYDPLFIVDFLGGTTVFPSVGNPGNPSIQWEETFTWDGGLEMRLLRDRISLTADIYTRKTKNMIAYNITAPLGTGSSQLTGNIGDVKNSGIELSLSASLINTGDFRWNLSANWSRNSNKLTRSFLPENTLTGTNLVNKVGYEYNSFYLREWAGVNPDNGRPMWIDSTGKPNESWSAAKPSIVGKAQPNGFGGIINQFSYKGLSLSVSFYYQYGSQIYAEPKLQNDGNSGSNSDPFLNQTRSALNRWQKPGDIAINPRRLLNGQFIVPGSATQIDQGTLASTRYLFDGDFIRLANVNLGYSFPSDWLNKIHLSSARLFLQVNNLATWTRYSGQDPENVGPSGFGNVVYPQAKSWSFGLNINF